MENKHRSLKSIFHMSNDSIDTIHRARLDSSSTITWPYTVGEATFFAQTISEFLSLGKQTTHFWTYGHRHQHARH